MSCGPIWAGDQRVKMLANIEAFGGAVGIVTITAPGAAVLPWAANGDRVVERAIARRWNYQARGNWRKLQRKAAQAARRYADRQGISWPGVLAGSWEFQLRGVLHRHQVVPMATAGQRMASQFYADTLSRLAEAHGFGYVDRGRRTRAGALYRRMIEVIPQERAARYLAKYIAGAQKNGELALTATVLHPDVPPHVTYVSRRMTMRTGVTMRTLRLRRREWHLDRRRFCGEVDAGRRVMAALEHHEEPAQDDVRALVYAALAHDVGDQGDDDSD